MSVGRQALLVLAHLRSGHTYAQLAAGFGVGTTTACRYIAEAIDALAALAPTLAEAMKTASSKAFVIPDGTLLPIDRIAADRGVGLHRQRHPGGRCLNQGRAEGDSPVTTASRQPPPAMTPKTASEGNDLLEKITEHFQR